MNAIGKRRLLKLADFLEGLPGSTNFHMGSLASEVKDGRPACGASACALGWGATIPSFRRAGFRLTRDGSLRVPGVRSRSWNDHAAHFFDMTAPEVSNVFGVSQVHSVGAVARRDAVKRIRNLVASKAA